MAFTLANCTRSLYISGFNKGVEGFLKSLERKLSIWEKSLDGKREMGFISDGKKPAKKIPTKGSGNKDDDDDDIVVCEISKNRRVSVNNWNGKTVVDIREFYIKDGEKLPGKKGISLTKEQWNKLREHVDEIDRAVADKE